MFSLPNRWLQEDHYQATKNTIPDLLLSLPEGCVLKVIGLGGNLKAEARKAARSRSSTKTWLLHVAPLSVLDRKAVETGSLDRKQARPRVFKIDILYQEKKDRNF